jgi:hypothetical protein
VPWVDFGRVLVEGDVFLKASVSAWLNSCSAPDWMCIFQNPLQAMEGHCEIHYMTLCSTGIFEKKREGDATA